MTRTGFTSPKANSFFAVLRLALLFSAAFTARAQEPPSTSTAAVSLTLKHAIELALQNSRDIQVASLQTTLADPSAMITKSQLKPNIYARSRAVSTLGIPETPVGHA